MLKLEHKEASVIGLGRSGQAACRFLRRNGASVTAVARVNNRDEQSDCPGRVKRVFPRGRTRKKIHAVGSIFTPCMVVGSLVEAVAEAAKDALCGDVVLLSPACLSWDQVRNHQHRGEVFCRAVKSICGGAHGGAHNIDGEIVTIRQ